MNTLFNTLLEQLKINGTPVLLLAFFALASCCNEKCITERVEIRNDTTYTETVREQEIMDETFFVYCDSIGNLYTALVDSLGNIVPITTPKQKQGVRTSVITSKEYVDNSSAYLRASFLARAETEKQAIIYKTEIQKIRNEKEKWQIISVIELLILLAAIVLIIKLLKK
jgi:hypothetical protein